MLTQEVTGPSMTANQVKTQRKHYSLFLSRYGGSSVCHDDKYLENSADLRQSFVKARFSERVVYAWTNHRGLQYHGDAVRSRLEFRRRFSEFASPRQFSDRTGRVWANHPGRAGRGI